MQASINALLLKAERSTFQDREFIKGELLVTSDESRSEIVRFSGDPAKGATGLLDLARMSPLQAEVDVSARSYNDGGAYLSCKLRSYQTPPKAK